MKKQYRLNYWAGVALVTGLFLVPFQAFADSGGEPAEFALFEEIPTVFSASLIEESILEAPAAISRIDSDDIEQWGILDVPDAFRFIPGIDVQALNGHEWGVTARGFNSRFAGRMLVLIDGMSTYIPSTSGTPWANVPLILEDIKTMEIIRGPNDTAYGFNAMNGVINITTFDPEETQGFYGRYIYGTNERDKFVARLGDHIDLGSMGELDFRLTYVFHQADGFGDNNGEEFQDAFKKNQVNSRLKYTYSDEVNLEVLTGTTVQYSQVPSIPTGIPTAPAHSQWHSVQTRLNFNPSEHHASYLQFYHWTFLSDSKVMQGGLRTRDTTQKQFDLEFRHTMKYWEGRSQTVLGGTFRQNRVENIIIKRKFDGRGPEAQTAKDDLYSFFATEKLTLLRDRRHLHKLNLVAGARLEKSGFIDNLEVAPRASVVYMPHENHSLRATYARAFKLPSFVEEHLFSLTPEPGGAFFQLFGSQGAEREQVHSYEWGYSGIFPEQNLNLDIDFYWAKYQGLAGVDIDRPLVLPLQPQIATFNNSRGAESVGIELEAHFKPQPWMDLFANYTFQNIVHENVNPLLQDFGDSVPKNKASFGINMQFEEDSIESMPFLDGFEFNSNLAYTDAYSHYDVNGNTNATIASIKSNLRLDLRLAKSFLDDAVEVAFIAQNLVGADHFEAQFVEVPRMFFLTVTVNDWPWEFFKEKPERKKGLIGDYLKR